MLASNPLPKNLPKPLPVKGPVRKTLTVTSGSVTFTVTVDSN